MVVVVAVAVAVVVVINVEMRCLCWLRLSTLEGCGRRGRFREANDATRPRDAQIERKAKKQILANPRRLARADPL